MLLGYARVSTGDQDPQAQRDALARAGVDAAHLYVDHTSGARSSRPQWDLVCQVARAGDVLVATRLDRVGRSTAHLVTLLDQLRERGVEFRFLEQGIDTTTSEGRLMYRMLAAIAEFQRDLIVANTHEGLAAARARGRTGGRKPKLSTQQAELAQQLYDAGEKTVAQIAALSGVPRTTVYNHLYTRPPARQAHPPVPAPAGDRTHDTHDADGADSATRATPEKPAGAPEPPAPSVPDTSTRPARSRSGRAQTEPAQRLSLADFDDQPYGLHRGQHGAWHVTEDHTRVGLVRPEPSASGRSRRWRAVYGTSHDLGTRNSRIAAAVLVLSEHRAAA